MGLFTFIEKGLGLRTGATQAAKQATEMGEVSLAEQTALKEEIGGIYDPRMQAGDQAFQDINAFYGGDQQAIIDQAQASPFRSALTTAGEEAIARNTQMTGGFRTGTTQENLVQNEQNVLMGLVDQILQGKQNITQSGFGATNAYTTAMQNIVAGTGATRGEIANIGINQAAQKANVRTGIGGMMHEAGMAFIPGGGGGGGMMSDIKLKNNIIKVDVKHGFPWYTWDWNKLAKDMGLTGSSEGHIAQEVQKVRPDLVFEKDGYLGINYGGF